MKKILFVNDEMTMGGVAKILNNLLSYFNLEEYEIDLLVLNYRGELLNKVPKGINVIKGTSFFKTIDRPIKDIIKNRSLSLFFNKIRLILFMKTGLINKIIRKERSKILSKQYDVEFAAKEGFCTVFVSEGSSKRKINWIQVDYKVSNYSINHMKLVKNALENIDLNVACSNIANLSYRDVFGIKNVITINNMLDTNQVLELKNKSIDVKLDESKINIITVARFHPQKGLYRLIDSFAEVKDKCDLYIIGDGELKDELHRTATDNNVDNLIHWLGIQENPYKYMSKMDMFVMSSLYEGYPTIVIESLLCGLPVLSTKVAGIDEQLDREKGWIVENSDEDFKEALIQVLSDKKSITDKKKSLEGYKYDNNILFMKMKEAIEGEK